MWRQASGPGFEESKWYTNKHEALEMKFRRQYESGMLSVSSDKNIELIEVVNTNHADFDIEHRMPLTSRRPEV